VKIDWFSFETPPSEINQKIQQGMPSVITWKPKIAATILPLEIVGEGTAEQALTDLSPLIFNYDNQTLYFAPARGYAGHGKIYNYLANTGIRYPNKEVHGYWDPSRKMYGEVKRSPMDSITIRLMATLTKLLMLRSIS
jgi:hypothetical protein